MIKILETLVAIYCFVGLLTGVPPLLYAGIVASLIAQVLVLVTIAIHRGVGILRAPLITYVISLTLIGVIIASSILAGNSLADTLNRGLSLLAIFGLTIIFCIPKIRIANIVQTVLHLFAILAVVIIADSASYIMTGVNMWPPEMYLGERFSGPFYDPNFLSITYAVLFIVTLLGEYTSRGNKKMLLILFGILIIFGSSWSAIAVLIIGLVAGKLLPVKNFGQKQIIMLAIYVLSLPLLLLSLPILYNNFQSTVASFNIGPDEAYAKFRSLEYRVIAQNDALAGIFENPFGHGPQSLVPDIGRDTHNSYMGFTYELGVAGLVLLLLNMTYRKSDYTKLGDALTTYFFLMALLINIHYTPIYFIMLLILHDSKKACLDSATGNTIRPKDLRHA